MDIAPKNKVLPYASLLAKLLRGPIEYLEKSSWESLLQHEVPFTGFLLQLGLQLMLDKEDGYAYLGQVKDNDGDPVVTWMSRRSFTYDESILLVLLREMMLQFETGETINRELVKKRREIKEAAEVFFKENASRVRFIRELDRLIERVCESGFLEKWGESDLPDEQKFRVPKWIKSRVDNEVLSQFKQNLSAYATERIQHG